MRLFCKIKNILSAKNEREHKMNQNLFEANYNGEGWIASSPSCEKMYEKVCEISVLDIKWARGWQ